jgi:hypothetical protein
MKYNYFDKQSIKFAYGFIPNFIKKKTQEQLYKISQRELQKEILRITTKKNEEEYLDFMSDILKRKS